MERSERINDLNGRVSVASLEDASIPDIIGYSLFF